MKTGRPRKDLGEHPLTLAILDYMEKKILNASTTPVECLLKEVIVHLSTIGIKTNVASVSRSIQWIINNTHIKRRDKFPNSNDPTKEYWIDGEVK